MKATSKNPNAEPAPDHLLREQDAAQILGVSIRTLQSWRQTRHGPAFCKLSRGCVRYRRTDLDTYIAAQTVTVGGV